MRVFHGRTGRPLLLGEEELSEPSDGLVLRSGGTPRSKSGSEAQRAGERSGNIPQVLGPQRRVEDLKVPFGR